MKKSSGFEKFYKGKEKTGGAKKEAIRKEKREIRKEREESIASAKRQKRAQQKASNSNQPPKYNLDPPAGRFQKKGTGKSERSSFKVEKKSTDRPEKFNRPESAKRFDKNNSRFEKREEKRFSPQGNREGQNKGDQRRGPAGERKTASPRSTNKFGNSSKPYEKENRFSAKKESRFASEKKPGSSRPTQGENVEKPASKTKLPATTKPLTDQMPLNKYISHSGVCSRRDAVDLIKGGKVKVNGELILEPGHKVALTDDVKVAGKKLNPVKDFIYILLNKPKDYITTTDDPQERKTVLDLLSGAPDVRIYPVGRLDRNTSGVLLLTNDGDLAQKLTHPSNEIKKVYAVTLDKPLTRQHFDAILKGVSLEDGEAHVDVLAYADAKDHTQIGVEIHSGRNRIVRRIFEHFGYDVKALDRVIFAGLTKKNVNRGKWRFLTEREVRDLKFFRKGR